MAERASQNFLFSSQAHVSHKPIDTTREASLHHPIRALSRYRAHSVGAQLPYFLGIPVSTLEHMLRYDLFPTLSPNLLSIAGEWQGIDEDWLLQQVQARMSAAVESTL
jgi:hypothetical protein